MTLLLRTIFRHQSNRLSSLLRKQFRPIDVCRINLHDERHHKKHDFPNIHIPTDVQPIEKRIHKKTKMYIYLGVIVVGVVAIGVSIVAIFRQFRSLYNPDIIHAAALARCINDPRVQDALGVPIKECEKQPFRHDIVYDRGGHPFMRIEFSIEGVQGKATVQLEKRLSDGKYRFFLVLLERVPHEKITIEDHRLTMMKQGLMKQEEGHRHQ